MSKAIDLTGQRFERLVVLERFGVDKHRYVMWLCQCDCGNQHVVRGRHLRLGEIQSCGCLWREMIRVPGRNRRHGHCVGGESSPTYRSWQAMLCRCQNPNDPFFHCYGGRGIKVCDRWRVFENFLIDMGERPHDKTLDRVDVEGDYKPDNCRWATLLEQARNRRPHLKAHRPDGLVKDMSSFPEWATVDWMQEATEYLRRATGSSSS